MVDHGCSVRYWSSSKDAIEDFILGFYSGTELWPEGPSHGLDFTIVIVDESEIFWLTLPKYHRSSSWYPLSSVRTGANDPGAILSALGISCETMFVGAEIPVWEDTGVPCDACNVFTDGQLEDPVNFDPALYRIELVDGFTLTAFTKRVLEITNRAMEFIRVESYNLEGSQFSVKNREVYDALNRAKKSQHIQFDVNAYNLQRGLRPGRFVLGELNLEILNPLLEGVAGQLGIPASPGAQPKFDGSDCRVSLGQLILDTETGEYCAEFELEFKESMTVEKSALAIGSVMKIGFEDILKVRRRPSTQHDIELASLSGSWGSASRSRYEQRFLEAIQKNIFLDPTPQGHSDWSMFWDSPSEIRVFVTKMVRDPSFGSDIPSRELIYMENMSNWQRTVFRQLSPQHYLQRLRLQAEGKGNFL